MLFRALRVESTPPTSPSEFLCEGDNMTEVIVKLDVPPSLENKFSKALDKIVNEFVERLKFSVAKDILSRSELTEKQAKKLADEVKLGIAKRHGLL